MQLLVLLLWNNLQHEHESMRWPFSFSIVTGITATLLLRPFISRSADMPSWTQPCGAPLFWVICSARIRVAMNLSPDCNTPAMQSGNESNDYSRGWAVVPPTRLASWIKRFVSHLLCAAGNVRKNHRLINFTKEETLQILGCKCGAILFLNHY